MFSGFKAPADSTLKKNLLGLASQLNAASSKVSRIGKNVFTCEISFTYIDHLLIHYIHFWATHRVLDIVCASYYCPGHIQKIHLPLDSTLHVPCQNLNIVNGEMVIVKFELLLIDANSISTKRSNRNSQLLF